MSEEAEKFGSCHFLSSKKVTNFEKLMHTAHPSCIKGLLLASSKGNFSFVNDQFQCKKR